METSHIYGNVAAFRGSATAAATGTIGLDAAAGMQALRAFRLTDALCVASGLLAVGGESVLTDCTVHHNRVEYDEPLNPSIHDIQGGVLEAQYASYALSGGMMYNAGSHRIERCRVHDNLSPDPNVDAAKSLFSTGGIAVLRAMLEVRFSILNGNFGRGGAFAIREGALRLLDSVVSNNNATTAFAGFSSGGGFIEGGVFAAKNVTWTGNSVARSPLISATAQNREWASNIVIRQAFSPTEEQRSKYGFVQQLEMKACSSRDGDFVLRGSVLILGTVFRSGTLLIGDETVKQFGSCTFSMIRVNSTAAQPHIIVRNSKFQNGSRIVTRLEMCDSTSTGRSLQTGTTVLCDRRALCSDATAETEGVQCSCATPGLDMVDKSEFKDGTLCVQRSSVTISSKQQSIAFVMRKPLDANLPFLLSARGDFEFNGTSNITVIGATSGCVQLSWIGISPGSHEFSLSTAQSEFTVKGAVLVNGSAIQCTDGSVLNANVLIHQSAADSTYLAAPRLEEQWLALSGSVEALPSCEHSSIGASISHTSAGALMHNQELSIALFALD